MPHYENRIKDKSHGHVMEQKLNMGLSYALGPFPDEPLLSAIDKALLYSEGLGKTTTDSEEKNVTNYNSPLATDCSVQRLKEVKFPPACINDPPKTPENGTEKYSEASFVTVIARMEECEELKETDNRLRIETQNNSNGIKSYEVWTEEVCQDCPSIVFILSPNGEAITFEYVPSQ